MADIGTVTPPLAETSSSPQPLAIAGFWRRILAFAVDGLLTAIPCFLIGSLFSARAESGAAWLGFLVTLAYFAWMGSEHRGGQTIGQKLLGMRVVDREGRPISLARSTVRYIILLLPMLASTLVTTSAGPWTNVLSLVLGTLDLAIVYLYIFNRRTRQSLHDLAVGAFVVEDGLNGSVQTWPVWKGHWVVFAVFLVGSAIGSLWMLNSAPLQELASLRAAIVASDPDIRDVGVIRQTFTNPNETKNGLRIEVQFRKMPADLKQAAMRIAAVALQNDPKAKDLDYIAVNWHEGFHVGFANFSKINGISHTPQEWQSLTSGGSGQ